MRAPRRSWCWWLVAGGLLALAGLVASLGGAAWAQAPTSAPAGAGGGSGRLPAGWRVLHGQPGWQAALAGQTVVILEEGFTHLRGLDVAGRPLWRTRYQDGPRGMQQLFVIDGQPLTYGGETLSRLDPRSGKVESRQRVPAHGLLRAARYRHAGSAAPARPAHRRRFDPHRTAAQGRRRLRRR